MTATGRKQTVDRWSQASASSSAPPRPDRPVVGVGDSAGGIALVVAAGSRDAAVADLHRVVAAVTAANSPEALVGTFVADRPAEGQGSLEIDNNRLHLTCNCEPYGGWWG